MYTWRNHNQIVGILEITSHKTLKNQYQGHVCNFGFTVKWQMFIKFAPEVPYLSQL